MCSGDYRNAKKWVKAVCCFVHGTRMMCEIKSMSFLILGTLNSLSMRHQCQDNSEASYEYRISENSFWWKLLFLEVKICRYFHIVSAITLL